MYDYLVIIQARLHSTRLPGKCLMTVGGIPMVKRVWDAAKGFTDVVPNLRRTIVAWPERYPDLDEGNVLERFRRIANEFPSHYIIRLTADCPLLTTQDIYDAFFAPNRKYDYYSNHLDGHDVQIFTRDYLFNDAVTHREHVIADFSTKPTGLSVNTREDLELVRRMVNAR